MILRALLNLIDVTAVSLGLICLGLGLAAQGGRFSGKLDVLTHFAPFYLAAAALVTGYGLICCLSSPRWGVVCLGLAGMAAAASLVIPEYTRATTSSAPAATSPRIKIIQLNGWSRNREVEKTATWIASQNADVIAVEELKSPLREAILRNTGMTYTRGMLDTGIFTRATPTKPSFELGEPWDQWPGLARVSIPVGGQIATIVAIHLTWPTEPWQKRQRASLAKIVKRTDPTHLIMVGDFNLTPWSFTLRRLDRDLQLRRRDRAIFSWPAAPFFHRRLQSPVPFLPIDHAYAGSAWKTVKIGRGPRLGSDHFPIVVTLALEP